MSDGPVFDVVLHIWGEGLSPEFISKELEIEPTRSQKKGEKLVSPAGNTAVAKTGYWEISTRKFGQLRGIAEHIERVLDQISYSRGKLDDLKGVDGAHIYVGVFHGEDSTQALKFEVIPSVLRKMVDLGIRFRFVIN